MKFRKLFVFIVVPISLCVISACSTQNRSNLLDAGCKHLLAADAINPAVYAFPDPAAVPEFKLASKDFESLSEIDGNYYKYFEAIAVVAGGGIPNQGNFETILSICRSR